MPSLAAACEASLRSALLEAVEENYRCRDIAASLDGNWQKCEFKSLNEVLTVTSFDNSKVLDLKCLSNRFISWDRNLYTDDPVKIEQYTSNYM